MHINMFSVKLKEFLATELTNLIFINFLRFKSKYKTFSSTVANVRANKDISS